MSSYLYLGVDIDKHLTFKTFYNNTLKKIAYKLSLLRRIRYMLTEKATLDIIKTMFCSVIDYGNIFLSSCIDGDLGDIQTLQNHALRCCYKVTDPRNYHVQDLHQAANIVSVDKRRVRQILTCIWRNINKDFIKIKIPLRHTRAAEGPTIYLPVPHTELYKKSVFYHGAFLWNNLPVNIRMQENIDSFKTLLYKHLL